MPSPHCRCIKNTQVGMGFSGEEDLIPSVVASFTPSLSSKDFLLEALSSAAPQSRKAVCRK